MKYDVIQTRTFRKSLKRMVKRGKEKSKLLKVVGLLAQGIPLPPEYKDHALSGNLAGLRDCHIENDWVLLYFVQDNILTLTLSDTGTHSDLF